MSSDSERPSAVQIAPASSHGRPASMLTVTSPSESGSISNSHTTSPSCRPALRLPIERLFERVPAPPGALPPTERTDVTSPPSTSTPSAPTFSGASLNSTRTLIRFSPSWRSGGETKRPRSALCADDTQNNSVGRDQAPHPSSPKRPRTRMLTTPNSPSRMWTVPVSS